MKTCWRQAASRKEIMNIELSDVSVHFQNGSCCGPAKNRRPVVRNITAKLRSGEMQALVGHPSYAAHTTIMLRTPQLCCATP